MGTATQMSEPRLGGPEGLGNRYLNIYVAERDWLPDIERVFTRTRGNTQQCQERVSAAILMPLVSKVQIPDPPENLLYMCHKYHQFEGHDWYDMWVKTALKDRKIASFRTKCENVGIIENVDFVPTTRQAYRWLIEESVNAGDLTDQNKTRVEAALLRLVWAYGGVPIVETFNKNSFAIKKEMVNWRTGYFFEKIMHKTFREDQLLIMKKEELRSNPTRVKTVKRT